MKAINVTVEDKGFFGKLMVKTDMKRMQ